MPDALAPAQADLQTRARRFGAEVLTPLAERLADRPSALREAVVAAAKEAGLYTLTQPAAYGGTPVDTVSLVAVREALAATGEPARHHVLGPGPGVLADADEPLRSRWLEPLLAGEKRGGFAFTDAPAGPPTAARRVPGGWRVSGTKSYVTGGANADFYQIVARLEADDAERGGAILLVAAADAPGLHRSPPFRSLDGSEHVALTLDDVFVGDDAVVGAPGQGLPRALRQIGDVRLAVAADACGLMTCALDHLEGRLTRPHRSGRPLGDREGVRLRFADARIEAFAARSMLYRTARLADAGDNVVNEGIATKVFATEAAGRVIDGALQLEGAGALVEGHLLERLYREVRAMRFAEGASDVLRLNLARGRLELGKGRL